MSINVFISFRYSDGSCYKEILSSLLAGNENTIDYSEDVDRSHLSEESIRHYLYAKLRRSSITIVILTPLAIEHQKNSYGEYDDWMYDEIRYSLDDRENNRTNGIIAVYTPSAFPFLFETDNYGFVHVKDIDNLIRRNMYNIKPQCYMQNGSCDYNRDYKSYCSLVPWNVFLSDITYFLNIAYHKRSFLGYYDIRKRLI